MAVIIHRKLVRDRIPEIIRQAGAEPMCRTLNKEEKLAALKEKLCEEAAEFKQSGELEELADVAEVLRAILRETGVSRETLEAACVQKYRERGGFDGGVWLEEVR